MTPSRWSTVLRRVTTEGPYINERMSVLVLTVVVLAGVSAVAYADKSVAPVSLAPLYFLPLALSALVHPLRISLALSIVCLVLHDLVGSVRDVGTEHLLKDAITLLGYVFVVVVVNQLGAQRRRLADKEGQIEKVIVVSRDITGRKQAEETKHRSDQLFRSIAENSADLIAVVDQSGHRIY